MSKSKTNDLNPVIISNALNSTLNHIANVMERTLDATTTAIPQLLSASLFLTSGSEDAVRAAH